MDKNRIGGLPPRYAFILNPYPGERLSRCPRCHKPTHPRKFALFIHVGSWGPFILGKTAVYCAPCELIIVHQHELEAQMAHAFDKVAPEVIGQDYLVLGTVDQAVWKAGLAGAGNTLEETRAHMADFASVLTLEVDPGGWYPAAPDAARRSRRGKR